MVPVVVESNTLMQVLLFWTIMSNPHVMKINYGLLNAMYILHITD